VALGLTYAIAAYVILPRAVRMGLKRAPVQEFPEGPKDEDPCKNPIRNADDRRTFLEAVGERLYLTVMFCDLAYSV
jgi:hypothetical protein